MNSDEGQKLLRSLGELKGKRLGCFCKPNACHGDILASLVDEQINPEGGRKLPGTVWGVNESFFGRIQGNNKERQEGCPNQLPEKYLERLILAYTNPGDTVLDPFAGSGTTATVAVSLGRNAVTCDVSEMNVELVKRRIKKGAVRI